MSVSKPEILDYYEFDPREHGLYLQADNILTSFQLRCKYCHKEIRSCIKVTSNWITHLKLHEDVYLQYVANKRRGGMSCANDILVANGYEPLKRPRISKSDDEIRTEPTILKFYIYDRAFLIRANNERYFQALCRICHMTVRGSIEITSNFVKHMKKSHGVDHNRDRAFLFDNDDNLIMENLIQLVTRNGGSVHRLPALTSSAAASAVFNGFASSSSEQVQSPATNGNGHHFQLNHSHEASAFAPRHKQCSLPTVIQHNTQRSSGHAQQQQQQTPRNHITSQFVAAFASSTVAAASSVSSLDHYKSSKNHTVESMIVSAFADALLPLSALDNARVRELFNYLQSDCVSAAFNSQVASTQILSQVYHDCYARLFRLLLSAQSLSVSFQVWSDINTRVYVGFHSHFLTDTWQLHSGLLQVRQVAVHEQHETPPSELVRELLKETLAEFKLRDKLHCLVVNSSASSSSASVIQVKPDELGFTAITHGLVESLYRSATAVAGASFGGDFNDEAFNLQVTLDDLALRDDYDDEQTAVVRVPCGLETLQLVVREAFAPASELLYPQLAKVAKIVNKIVCSLQQYAAAAEDNDSDLDVDDDDDEQQEHMRELKQVLKYCSASGVNLAKWNAQLTVIEMLLGLSQTALDYLAVVGGGNGSDAGSEETPSDELELKQADREMLRELVDLLKPFQELLDDLRDDKSAISLLLPGFRGIRLHLERHKTKLFHGVVKALKSSLFQLFGYLESDALFAMAAMLNPNLGLSWLDVYDRAAKEQQLVAYLKQFNDRQRGNNKATDRATPSSPSSPLSKRKSYRSYLARPEETSGGGNGMQGADSENGEVTAATLEESAEVARYLELIARDMQPTESFRFWREHEQSLPHLASLARRVLSVPAMSAVSAHYHRITDAKSALCEERRRLTDEHLETLLFVKYNNGQQVDDSQH